MKENSLPFYSTLENLKFSNNLKHKKSSIIEILTAFKKFKFKKNLNWEILKLLFVLWLQQDYYSLLEASERNLKTEKEEEEGHNN
jgi:hypothetical protein